MLFDHSQVISKAKVVSELPYIAAEGELALLQPSNVLFIYVGNRWIDISSPNNPKMEFCVYLPTIPDHSTTIFKCVMPCSASVDVSEIMFDSINDLQFELFVNNEFVCKVPADDIITIEKGKCLSLRYIHKERHFPEDLAMTIIANRIN